MDYPWRRRPGQLGPLSRLAGPGPSASMIKSGKSRNPKKHGKRKSTFFSYIFWEFRPENPFPEVPQSSCIFWDARNPFLRHFIFSSFVRPGKNQTNDAETATCYRSLEENSPWDHAQIKERPTWRSIARSRALYDQMAPQLCLFYISAKFDFRLTRQNLVYRPSDPRMRRTFGFSTLECAELLVVWPACFFYMGLDGLRSNLRRPIFFQYGLTLGLRAHGLARPPI